MPSTPSSAYFATIAARESLSASAFDWPANEDPGSDTLVEIINSRNGTGYNYGAQAMYVNGWLVGNGTNQFTRVVSTGMAAAMDGGFTYACWYKTAVTNNDFMIGTINATPGTDTFQVEINEGGSPYGVFHYMLRGAGGASRSLTTDPNPNAVDGNPHFLVVAVDAGRGTVRYYFDGQIIKTNDAYTTPGPANFENDLTIFGRYPGGAGTQSPFEGSMKHIKLLCGYGVTDSEAAQMYTLETASGGLPGIPGTAGVTPHVAKTLGGITFPVAGPLARS